MNIHRLLSFSFLIAILLIGAYLRLYKISEYMTFLGDEGRDVLVVRRMIVDHKFTLLGPTASVGGFFLGPIYYYFMIPFLWAWGFDPTGPAVMVAIFGIATIYLIYKVGSYFFEPLVGFIAASIYAVSPVVIAYSRSSWNPNLVPFFSLLLIFFLWRVTQVNRRNELFWVGIILGIGLQLHYLFLFLFFVVGIWLLLHNRKGKTSYIKYYLFAVIGFLLAYSPFIVFELRHNFANTKTIMQFLQEGKDTGFSSQIFLKNVNDISFRSFARLLFRYPQKEVLETLPQSQRNLWSASVYLTIILAGVLGIAAIFRDIIGRLGRTIRLALKETKGWILLLLWFSVVVISFGFYKRTIYDYYLGVIFPAPFLFISLVIARLYTLRSGALLGAILWGGLLYLNWMGRPFIYPPNNQLAQVKKIAKTAYDMIDGQPFNFALVANFNSDHAYRYFFEVWGHPPDTIENEVLDPERKSVTRQLIVICEVDNCKPLGHPLWEIAGFGRAKIERVESVPFVKIYKLVHYEKES